MLPLSMDKFLLNTRMTTTSIPHFFILINIFVVSNGFVENDLTFFKNVHPTLYLNFPHNIAHWLSFQNCAFCHNSLLTDQILNLNGLSKLPESIRQDTLLNVPQKLDGKYVRKAEFRSESEKSIQLFSDRFFTWFRHFSPYLILNSIVVFASSFYLTASTVLFLLLFLSTAYPVFSLYPEPSI